MALFNNLNLDKIKSLLFLKSKKAFSSYQRVRINLFVRK